VAVFERLDFLYVPSRDVAAEARYFADVLGARLVFAIEAMGTRVAMLELTDDPPALLLAGHLAGERPVLVYRVADLGAAAARLEGRGWEPRPRFEIPHGPCCSFEAPGGHRIALYERTRPGATEHFAGRRDF
jgi:catechol 2,3-dioxygenase-like lactoylglutathione lyase family enzyme